MRWRVRVGDILDEPADVLICSANPFLTLSGGVGGALLLRYGNSFQQELQDRLDRGRRRFFDRGTIVITHPKGVPYRAIIHAIAGNAFYESSPETIANTVNAPLLAAASTDATNVALAALATGYGRMRIADFGRGPSELLTKEYPPKEQVTVVIKSGSGAGELHPDSHLYHE